MNAGARKRILHTFGKILGNGNKVGWIALGVRGDYKVTVTDGRGGKAQASVNFRVVTPEEYPTANSLTYSHLSSREDLRR